MKAVAILYGGRSGEHEVSLISAASIVKNLSREKYSITLIGIAKDGKWYLQDMPAFASDEISMAGMPAIQKSKRVMVLPGAGLWYESSASRYKKLPCDIVFPVLHGTFGEDGTVQGLLECADLPYVGAGVLGSSIGMDKAVTKALWAEKNLPITDYLVVRAEEMKRPDIQTFLTRKIEARFGWPCFVKPACAGSSVGASKVSASESLLEALHSAFLYDNKVLIEQFIPAREIECAVLGNENPVVFAPGEIIPTHEFYDYEAKYKDPEGARLEVPAKLLPSQEETIKKLALEAYTALTLHGMARVDFFMDKRTGNIMLNEVNTIPGFTAISMYPRMCRAGGLSYPELLDRLLDLGEEEYAKRQKIAYSFSNES
ncbi:MAG: D-alanine--D-alanine ligase [Spirochaetia bacterium]|nr:D-alanine--D-alanine ligase [Spirochaetia bacterium]